MSVGEGTATTLALIVHELATNSLKYGALSVPAGTLDVSGTDGEHDLTIAERGGPPVEAPNGASGFGSSMVKRAVAGQLAGTINYDWSEAGAIITLIISKARLVA